MANEIKVERREDCSLSLPKKLGPTLSRPT